MFDSDFPSSMTLQSENIDPSMLNLRQKRSNEDPMFEWLDTHMLRLDLDIAEELWKRELILVGKMLVRDIRVFHGKGYRRMAVAELGGKKLHDKSIVESEFKYITKMIHAPKRLSNFSSWHRRSKLIPRLLDERNAYTPARKQFLDDGKLVKTVLYMTDALQVSISPPCTRAPIHTPSQPGSITNSY